jgi:hypothetical protein
MAQRQSDREPEKAGKGKMTVEEAGRLGGHKGGQRVKQLVEEGKRLEREEGAEAQNREDVGNEEEEDGEA